MQKIGRAVGANDSRTGERPRPPYAALMISRELRFAREARRGVLLVIAVQALSVALVVGWFAAGHASAPDRGLQQLDLISLDEVVPGLTAVDGRPTMVVVTCAREVPERRELDASYGLVVSTDATLARRLALPRAVQCQAGYVLLDEDSRVRYRTYDPGWVDHSFEQEVLLAHLDGHG